MAAKNAEEVDSMDEINSILNDFNELNEEVIEFKGTDRNMKYRFLDEMLSNCMTRLLTIDKDGNETVRKLCEDTVVAIQKCMDLLDKKLVDNNETKLSNTEINDKWIAQMSATESIDVNIEKQNNNNNKSINEKKNQPQITLLLLGETGVGKSTFINAFVNYMIFDKMNDAINKLICLIPTKFTLTDPETDLDKECTFGTPNDSENTKKTSESATQYPRCYTFDFGDYRLNIIDTPGICDTDGLDKDKRNIQNILNFISNYNTINAICLLLKPNQSRGTTQFMYTINELLSHLNKSAADNIMFVFTNARSTFYAPGDTMVPLKAALEKIKLSPPYVRIKFDKTNRFCFDNESFRYLVAVSQPNNVMFDEDIQKLYGNSWERSVNECLRMMTYITDVKPHNVKDTLSVNEAKRTIKLLTQPLADISKNIADNINECEIRKKKMEEFDGNIEELKRELFIPVVEIESTPLDYPMTVCEDRNCVEIVVIDGQTFKHYRQLCHEHCNLRFDDGNVVGNVGILGCIAFNDNFKKYDNCLHCGHSYKTHLHVRYETRKVDSERRDEFKYSLITDKQQALIAQKEIVAKLADRQIEFENESKVINECMAEFAAFLKHNALTPFNDAFEDYVKHLIKVEEYNVSLVPEESKQSVEQLEQMLKQYQHEKCVILDSMKKGDKYSAVTLDDINNSVNKLYELPIYGQKIQQLMNMQLMIGHKVYSNFQQHVIEVPVNTNKSIVKSVQNVANKVTKSGKIVYKTFKQFFL
ncbi:uncharacterized protein LOC128963094 [Oppia nitens]|uniref:uncharacterized protein LOC128963094 n=1 Tax=Oppia nitens TaxID=1686743 RepID=UPI0023DC4DD9|nr:uncharacterized protein LOC128963094 [Oppia nitens]